MTDFEKRAVMAVLRELTGGDDVYKVIEADEILQKLPDGVDMDKQSLSVAIRDLRDRDYIKVKYFTPDEYCLLTLKRTEELAHIVEEAALVATKEKVQSDEAAKKTKPSFGTGVKLFFTAFAGAFMGGGIVGAIFAIIFKFAL